MAGSSFGDDVPGSGNAFAWLLNEYHECAELTQGPQPLEPIELSYPVLATGEEAPSGAMRLRLLIAEDGTVDRVLVESSELPQAFQDEAIMRFSLARFDPGRIQDAAVKSQLVIEVTAQPGE